MRDEFLFLPNKAGLEARCVRAGGKIKVRVVSKGLHLRYPDTRIEMWAKDLHAPMAERVLELPFDVYNGAPSHILPPPLTCRTAKSVVAGGNPRSMV